MAAKRFITTGTPGLTYYINIRKRSDLTYLRADDSWGANDNGRAMTEDGSTGLYELTIASATPTFPDGLYDVFVELSGIRKSCGSMYIVDDAEVVAEQVASRLLGLAKENQVIDDEVYNAAGLMTTAVIYCYNSKANATTHDKATGLTAKYTITATYDTANKMTLMKTVLEP